MGSHGKKLVRQRFWLLSLAHLQPQAQVMVLPVQKVFVQCEGWKISLELLVAEK